MRSLSILVAALAALPAASALACGSGSEKPPLVPDTDHPAEIADAGASSPSPSTPSPK